MLILKLKIFSNIIEYIRERKSFKIQWFLKKLIDFPIDFATSYFHIESFIDTLFEIDSYNDSNRLNA